MNHATTAARRLLDQLPADDMPTSQRAVLLLVCDAMNARTGVTYTGDWIGRALALHERTVRRFLSDLAAAGYLDVEQRTGRAGIIRAGWQLAETYPQPRAYAPGVQPFAPGVRTRDPGRQDPGPRAYAPGVSKLDAEQYHDAAAVADALDHDPTTEEVPNMTDHDTGDQRLPDKDPNVSRERAGELMRAGIEQGRADRRRRAEERERVEELHRARATARRAGLDPDTVHPLPDWQRIEDDLEARDLYRDGRWTG